MYSVHIRDKYKDVYKWRLSKICNLSESIKSVRQLQLYPQKQANSIYIHIYIIFAGFYSIWQQFEARLMPNVEFNAEHKV